MAISTVLNTLLVHQAVPKQTRESQQSSVGLRLMIVIKPFVFISELTLDYCKDDPVFHI